MHSRWQSSSLLSCSDQFVLIQPMLPSSGRAKRADTTSADAKKQKTIRHMQYIKIHQRVSMRLLPSSCSVRPSSPSPLTNEYRSGSELIEQTSNSEVNWALLPSILPRNLSHQAVQSQRWNCRPVFQHPELTGRLSQLGAPS